MVDARRVRDDEGGAGVCFRFADRLEHLILIGAHIHLCDVDVAIGDRHHAEILLLRLFPRRSELRDRSRRGRLRCLSARVGVDLGIEHHDVDILARCKHMVKAAIADVICPSVTAEDPLRALDEVVVVAVDAAKELVTSLLRFEEALKRACAVSCALALIALVKPCLHRRAELLGALLRFNRFNHRGGERFADGLRAKVHAETVLRIVLEQGVRPRGSLSLRIRRVRHRGCARTPDGGAAGRVRDQHPIAKELCDELCIRRLTAARTRARELKERLFKLRSNDRGLLHWRILDRDLLHIDAKVEILLRIAEFVVEQRHIERLARADLRAIAAAKAVERGDRNREIEVLCLAGLRLDGLKSLGRRRKLLIGREHGTDGSMRADE